LHVVHRGGVLFYAAANSLLRAFLAPMCVSCHAPLDHPLQSPICLACWRAVPLIPAPWCSRCGDALPSRRIEDAMCPRCIGTPPCFAIARSAGLYDGPLRELIHALKFERRRMIAPPLAALMIKAGADILAGADAVVPVPLHPLRGFSRGFNQADDLARHLGLPVWRVLRRTRAGPPQASLPANRRHDNVTDAFAPKSGFSPQGFGPLRDRILVVIDDVMTTGATLDACSRVLMEAGAGSVRALTVARAVAARLPSQQPPQLPSTVQRR
jgi:ComF family protein